MEQEYNKEVNIHGLSSDELREELRRLELEQSLADEQFRKAANVYRLSVDDDNSRTLKYEIFINARDKYLVAVFKTRDCRQAIGIAQSAI